MSAKPSREPDPDYDQTPPIPKAMKARRGRQCGECGLKVEYGQSFGYFCPTAGCPMGFGPTSFMAATP